LFGPLKAAVCTLPLADCASCRANPSRQQSRINTPTELHPKAHFHRRSRTKYRLGVPTNVERVPASVEETQAPGPQCGDFARCVSSFLPIFLATLRSWHCVPAKLPLVADKNEKVAANVPPARCFLQLRRGIPRGVAALRLHTHWTGSGAGLARDFQHRHQFHQNEYCHVKTLFNTN